ncbi:PAS domain S-box protein [Candidatus Woesearchaeota archaeon]|nr:PAS domain S-box protein [Candidatus Woesearchaeota archaeon]
MKSKKDCKKSPLKSEALLNMLEDLEEEKNKAKKSEEKLKNILSAIDNVIYSFTPDGKVTFVSEKIKECGYDPEDFYNNPKMWLKMMHPDDAKKQKKIFKKFMKNKKKKLEREYILICKKTKKNKIVKDTLVKTFDRKGNPKMYYGSMVDITEQKKAEEDIKNMFNFSGALVCIADIKGHFKQLSPAWMKLLGYSEKELLSKPFMDFVHPEDRKKTEKIIKNNLKKGKEAVHFENRYRCKDGSYKHLDWVSRPLLDEGIVYAVAHDITDKKKAEEALKESEEKYRKVIENLSDVIYSYDPKTLKVGFITPNVRSFFGYKPEEVIGHKIDEFIHPEDLKQVYEDMKKTIKTGKASLTKARLKKKNGKYILIEEKGSVEKEKGKTIHINGVIRISDKKSNKK